MSLPREFVSPSERSSESHTWGFTLGDSLSVTLGVSHSPTVSPSERSSESHSGIHTRPQSALESAPQSHTQRVTLGDSHWRVTLRVTLRVTFGDSHSPMLALSVPGLLARCSPAGCQRPGPGLVTADQGEKGRRLCPPHSRDGSPSHPGPPCSPKRRDVHRGVPRASWLLRPMMLSGSRETEARRKSLETWKPG